MARISPLVALPPVLFAGLAAMFLWGMDRGDDANQLPSTLIGKEPPALPETTLPGLRAVTADDLKSGRATVVNFWASWCPPCREEHPTLTALAAEGIPVLGVNLKDTERNAAAFLNGHGNPFAAISTDPQGRAAIDWGVTAPPETFIIDAEGKVLYRYAGPLVGEAYSGTFRPLLDRAGAQ